MNGLMKLAFRCIFSVFLRFSFVNYTYFLILFWGWGLPAPRAPATGAGGGGCQLTKPFPLPKAAFAVEVQWSLPPPPGPPPQRAARRIQTQRRPAEYEQVQSGSSGAQLRNTNLCHGGGRERWMIRGQEKENGSRRP
jgi:hypothetical protein